MIARGDRVAFVGPPSAADAALARALAESRLGRIAHAGRDLRPYPYMSVGRAERFQAAISKPWDATRFATVRAAAGLESYHAIRRLKRSYARALVVALLVATSPDVLVIEGIEELDEAATGALDRAFELVPTVLVTCATEETAARFGARIVSVASLEVAS